MGLAYIENLNGDVISYMDDPLNKMNYRNTNNTYNEDFDYGGWALNTFNWLCPFVNYASMSGLTDLEDEANDYDNEEYECDDFTDGIQTADKLGYDHKLVYKTLVTTGKTGNHYVFVIPIEAEIDFKKAAKVVGEKSLEMLHLKDLTKVTGYVRGGCTAIGMKKQFPTVIQEDAKELEYMHVSGGKLGMQIRLAPQDLQKVAKAEFADVIRP